MTTHTGALWIPRPRPQAACRLYCFPYAGGGANVFRGWEQSLGPRIELAAVQLPGREWRRSEPALTRLEALAEHLADALAPRLEEQENFAFFGYSMGAALAFALVRRLRQLGLPLPQELVVAACRAPQLLRRAPPIYSLGDYEFLAAIKRFGGIPQAVLDEPDLLKLVLPVLRADFEVLGTFTYDEQAPLPLPITVYGGSHDPHASRAELAEWRAHTSAQFKLRLFSGSHFFINEVRDQLLQTLNSDMAAHLPPAMAATGAWRQQDRLPV